MINPGGILLSMLLQWLADFSIKVQTGEIYIYVAAGFQLLGIIKLLHTVIKMIRGRNIERSLSALIKSGLLIALGILVQVITSKT